MDAGVVSSAIFNLINAIFVAFTLTFWGLFSLLRLLASPLLYVAHGLLGLVLSPLQLLVKFESFLYFVTGAILMGVTIGLVLHLTSDALSQLFPVHQSSPRPRLVSHKEYDFRLPKDEPIDWESEWVDRLPSSTIVEEEENSQVSD